MLIAQITDLHVVAGGQLCRGRVDANVPLQEAVAARGCRPLGGAA